MVSDGASAWGLTKMESSGTTNFGDGGAPGSGSRGHRGIDGLEATEGGMRAPAPQLPLPRQDTLGRE